MAYKHVRVRLTSSLRFKSLLSTTRQRFPFYICMLQDT